MNRRHRTNRGLVVVVVVVVVVGTWQPTKDEGGGGGGGGGRPKPSHRCKHTLPMTSHPPDDVITLSTNQSTPRAINHCQVTGHVTALDQSESRSRSWLRGRGLAGSLSAGASNSEGGAPNPKFGYQASPISYH